jgi:hypothetical protein
MPRKGRISRLAQAFHCSSGIKDFQAAAPLGRLSFFVVFLPDFS